MKRIEKVEVPADLLEACKAWGKAREEENKNAKNAKAYDHDAKLPWTSLQASCYAVVGEVAVALWFGLDPWKMTWVHHRNANGRYDKSLHTDADLKVGKSKIEVRNCVSRFNPIYVKPKDVRADAYVVQVHVVLEDGRPTGQVEIIGWIEASAAKRLGTFVKERGYWAVANKKVMALFPVKKVAA